MAAPAAILSILVKAQGAQAAIGQLNGVDVAARKASGGVDMLEKKSASGRASFDKVGKAAGFVALGVAGIGAAAVKAAANYQSSMNTLQAVSGSTAGEMEKLRKLSIKLGADIRLPGTSAQDAAEAMTEMIKAGVSLKDTMAGVRDVLVLSAAAGVSNAEAAEIASNALNAFKLSGKDVGMVTDQLANTANASSVEIRDVADAMKMAASVFSGFQAPTLGAKGAITELNVAIGLLGNAGIKGSDAGTSLKQMLLQLTGPSDKAKTAMQALFFAAKGNAGQEGELTAAIHGTSKERQAALDSLAKLNPALRSGGDIAFDSAGKMRSLKDIIALVTAGTKSMTDEQKNAYITQVFGADATRSVIALMNAGPAAFDKMTASVTKQGAAQALADAKMKGFKGSMEALKSTLETLAINVGTQLLPALTALVKQMSAVASALSPTAWLVLIGVIGTLAVSVFAINTAVKVYEAGLVATTAAQWLFNAALTANPIGIVVVALAALAAAVLIAYNRSETFRKAVELLWKVLRTGLVSAINSVLGAFSSFLGAVSAVAKAVGADGLAAKAKAGQTAIDDLRDSLNNVPSSKDVDVKVKISLDGQDIDVTNAKPLSPTPPGGDGPGVIGSRINDLVRANGGVKDGIKKLIADGIGSMIPGVGGAVGSLMGASASLRPFAAVGAQFGLHVSSGKRNGTGSSYHNIGQAIDLANGRGPDAAKLATFRALKSRYGSQLAELIYTPGGVGIKDGQPFRYTGSVAADHYDHVHVAFTGGSRALGQAGNRGDGPGAFMGDGLGSNAKAIYQFMRHKGFTPGQAAGWVGVLNQESGLSTSAVNPRSGATGIAQWLGGRLANLKKRSDWRTLQGQLNFLWSELQGPEGAALSRIRGAKGVADATSAITWGFERPGRGEANMPHRLSVARQAFNSFKGLGAGGGGGASKATTTGTAPTAAKVNPLEQKIAAADLAIQQATSGPVNKAAWQAASTAKTARDAQVALAKSAKRKLLGKRIRSIRKALKGKLSPAKRLALTQELTQKLGEHSQLGQEVQALLHPAVDTATTDIGGGIGGDVGGTFGGDTGDPNQALIDSNAALQASIDAQVQAEKEHTDAVNALKDQVKQQNAIAGSTIGIGLREAQRALADMISGQIGAVGVGGRQHTAGAGTVVRY